MTDVDAFVAPVIGDRQTRGTRPLPALDANAPLTTPPQVFDVRARGHDVGKSALACDSSWTQGLHRASALLSGPPLALMTGASEPPSDARVGRSTAVSTATETDYAA